MQKIFITKNSRETQKLGELLAQSVLTGGTAPRTDLQSKSGAWVFCLDGELGAGKTTFTQGFLKGLGVQGPYTSPTFVIMKKYENVFHFDAYRVSSSGILDLGWEEIIADQKNIVLVEWSDRIKKILPKNAIKLKFEWVSEKERRVTLSD